MLYKKTLLTSLLLLAHMQSFNRQPFNWWFHIVPVKDLILQHPEIQYQPCFEEIPFSFNNFSPNPSEKSKGTFKECFILTIPNGIVQSQYGFVVIHKKFISEMIWTNLRNYLSLVKDLNPDHAIKVPGRVAVISQIAYFNYYHWLVEVLGRLALLEMHHIEYDWLYVPNNTPVMKKTLELWGVDPKKIISPPANNTCSLQADQIILPSFLMSTNIGFDFTHPYTNNYVRNKLLTAVLAKDIKHNFNKKVFISRQDTGRKFTNENDIFNALKSYGFEKYELSKLSFEEQVLLFNNAEIVIGEHGAGLANVLFCKPNTQVIEIFQELKSICFWALANLSGLNYNAIKTMEFEQNYMKAWRSQAPISHEKIQETIKILNKQE